jgi:hypothetical protein
LNPKKFDQDYYILYTKILSNTIYWVSRGKYSLYKRLEIKENPKATLRVQSLLHAGHRPGGLYHGGNLRFGLALGHLRSDRAHDGDVLPDHWNVVAQPDGMKGKGKRRGKRERGEKAKTAGRSFYRLDPKDRSHACPALLHASVGLSFVSIKIFPAPPLKGS